MNNDTNLIFEAYKSVNEDLGLGPMISRKITVPGPGSQSTGKVVVMKIDDNECEEAKKEEETVYIQAGEPESGCGCGCDNCGCDDGEEEMADSQLNFIDYASDEIAQYIEAGHEFPEWFQNKLTAVHTLIKDLHAYIEGERQQEEENEY